MNRPRSRKLLVSRLVEALASQPWPTYLHEVPDDGCWCMGVVGLSEEVHVYAETPEQCRKEFPDMLRAWLMSYVDMGELPKGIGLKVGHGGGYEVRCFDLGIYPSPVSRDAYTASGPLAVLP